MAKYVHPVNQEDPHYSKAKARIVKYETDNAIMKETTPPFLRLTVTSDHGETSLHHDFNSPEEVLEFAKSLAKKADQLKIELRSFEDKNFFEEVKKRELALKIDAIIKEYDASCENATWWQHGAGYLLRNVSLKIKLNT